MAGERKDIEHTLNKLAKIKANKYAPILAPMRLRPRVLQGYVVIVYRTCAYTTLGELGKGTRKDIGCAAIAYKRRVLREIRRRPRDDGKSAAALTTEFLKLYRTRLQFALARGNAALALAVGL